MAKSLSMIGIVICIIATWLILKLTNTRISVLGIKPKAKRLKQFGLGLGFSTIAALIYYSLSVLWLEANLEFNAEYDLPDFLYGVFWTFRSVLFEELIWRGILLYLLIKYMGVRNGIIVSAITFGIWHWFSYDILGNYMQMVAAFLLTGIAGIMFGYAYALTGSLYLPVSLHLGWNLVTILIFSQGPLGDQLLKVSSSNQLEGILSLLFFLVQLFILPIIVLLYFYFLKRKQGKYLVPE